MILTNIYKNELVTKLDETDKSSPKRTWFKAVKESDINTIREMVEDDFDIETRNENQDTALLLAATQGNAFVCETLLEQGANPDQTDPSGLTPLMWSVYSENINVSRILLEYEANIDSQDDNGWTALIWAAQSNQMRFGDMLFPYYPNTELYDYETGWTALHFLAANGNVPFTKLLLKNHAKFEVLDKKDRSILDIAQKYQRRNLYNLLVDYSLNGTLR